MTHKFFEQSFLIRMNYEKSAEQAGYNLLLCLSPSPSGEAAIELTFIDVKDLKIDRFGGLSVQLAGLTVTDISALGWENQHWEISDTDRNKLFFRAREFSVAGR